MKILQLGKFYPIRGGVEKVEYDLMQGLCARGISCDMLCAGNEGRSGIVEQCSHGAIFAPKTWVTAAGTTIAPAIITWLRRHCSDYDIIHVHHPDPMAALALYLSGYKGHVVLHWHSDIIKQDKALKLYMPLQHWLTRRAERIICTTPVYMHESPHLKHVQEKCVAVPIGIMPVSSADEEKVAALRKKYDGRKIIFSLGRLVEYKGYEYLVKAATHLPDDCVVIIGGSGPLRAELDSLISRLNLTDKVHLLGRVSDEELPTLYHACDVYCMSSVQRTEAFGIVQIEAMSCGKPLVATKIPGSGVAWVNADGESGLNAKTRSADDLARVIKQIIAHPDDYARYAEGSRQRFQRIFTYDKMIQSCIDIYKKITK